MRPSTVLCLAVSLPALLAVPRAGGDDNKPDVFALNRELGRGINLGNALDAPKEGDWGYTLEAEHFKIVKDAGFRTVRLPVRWSAHADPSAPYTIDSTFFRRVDWALDQAEANKLNVVLNVHHYDELYADPKGHLPRLIGLWKQIADRYKKRPASVVFELCNEPHDKLDAVWNDALPELLKTVRATNPTRPVAVGPGTWNNISALPRLKLPDDEHLIVTVHFYEPFRFTHQGASWAPDDVKKLSGIKWSGTDDEMRELRKQLDLAAEWGKKNKRPIFVGEFGAYEKADMASRARWTAAVTAECAARDFSWAYWEFASSFGAYDRDRKAWREPLRTALLPK